MRAVLLTMIVSCFFLVPAFALEQFSTKAQAQQHCPKDVIVWLELPTMVWSTKGQDEYGNTKHGAYVCEKEAAAGGAHGDTPSHLALGSDGPSKHVVELLLARGADVNAKNDLGDTPLHVAADWGDDRDMVELLLVKGADVNAKNNDGETPLCSAAYLGNKDVVELLLAKGADVNAKSNLGDTPLHYAADRGGKDVMELLLAKGAGVNAKDNKGNTPLHQAARNYKGLAEWHGVHIYPEGTPGYAPLNDEAKEKEYKQMAELLLARGADVNAKDNGGYTPLHLAVGKDKELAELLLAGGADVNAKDNGGYTPLHRAVVGGYKVVAELLHQHGGYE